jgi:hypothetical protein
MNGSRRSWSLETGRHWRQDNPASGQCGVAALVIHDGLAGEILKTEVDGAWHFCNQIDGRRVDFTMSQLDSPIFYDDLPSNRNEAGADTTRSNTNCFRNEYSPPDGRDLQGSVSPPGPDQATSHRYSTSGSCSALRLPSDSMATTKPCFS